MSWMNELGEEIKTTRELAGLTLEAVASQLSVSRQQLSNYEKGNNAVPVNILIEIARALKADSLTVEGYKIVPEDYAPKPIPAPAQQLAFPFGEERRFGDASLRIDPAESSGGVVITAVFKEPRSA